MTKKMNTVAMSAAIAQSVADVLKARGFVVGTPVAGDPALQPIAEQLDEETFAGLLREIGNNTTQVLLFAALEDDEMQYELDLVSLRDLRRAASKHHAGGAELAAIERLERFEATAADVERLESLANLAGLPWVEMFADVFEQRSARCVTCERPTEGSLTCGATACRTHNDSRALPPSGAAEEERDGTATPPFPTTVPSRSGCTPAPADRIAVGHTLRSLAQQKRPNSDTAEVLGRVGEWLVREARAS